MFSAILQGVGALGGVVGGIMSAQQNGRIAQEELALRRSAQRDQKDMAMLQYGIGLDQLRRERESERYLREENERKQRYLDQEYGLRLDSQRARAAQSMEERQYMLDRQVSLDRAAAQQREFQLNQLLRNQDLSQAERQYAIQMLEDARATAQGERDEDLMRFYQEREQAGSEREFSIDELRRTQDIARQERLEDVRIRDRVLSQSDQLRQALFETFGELGEGPAAPRMTQAMLDEEIGRRETRAMADADRAIDRVASVGEADLMRRGVERSSGAIAKRSEIAERGSALYAQARERARDEAFKYMSGVQDSLFRDYEGQLKERSVALQDTEKAYGTGLDIARMLPQAASANNYRSPVDVRSAVYSRQVRSGNDFRAPINVGSGIYDKEIGLGMAQTLGIPSAADALALNPGSRLNAGYASPSITSPSGFMGNMATLLNGSASGYNPAPYLQLASSGAQAAGSSFSNLLKVLQGSGFGGGQTFQSGTVYDPITRVPYTPTSAGASFGGWWSGGSSASP